MNKHTDDQSSPTFPPATSEANFEFSGHLPLPSTGLLHQARGNLKDDGNEDKVEVLEEADRYAETTNEFV